MNDFIDVKLGFLEYVHNVANVIYRYINNSVLKKVLIFPLFLIILLLELSIFPVALVGAIIKWIIVLVVDLTEDNTKALWILIVMFIELFALYYILFFILWMLYKVFDFMSYGVGKGNYDVDMTDFSDIEETSNNEKNYDNSKKEDIYVINEEAYK